MDNPEKEVNFDSKVPESPSKSLQEVSNGMPLEDDIVALEDDIEALDVNQAGATVILSPKAVKITYIPFSTEEHIRGWFG